MTENDAMANKNSVRDGVLDPGKTEYVRRLTNGAVINHSYKVLEFLGSGGMSDVYKCEDLTLSRVIAIKTLPQGAGPGAIRRFQTEGKAIAKLQHENIVKLYGLQLTDEGLPILCMEYVPGVTLNHLLESNQALSVQRTLHIAAQICEALKAAESQGVIHRDLKPSNIMIVNAGSLDERVKILDFGIAKIQGDVPINVTATGDVFGTPQYMSPEQASGKKCDARTDQYSLGCVIFEMLTGAPPFTADNSLQVMMAHIQDPIPSLNKAAKQALPRHLDAAVTRLLQKDPDDRFSTMDEASRAIFGATVGTKIGAAGLLSAQSVRTGIVIVLVSMIGIAIYAWLNRNHQPRNVQSNAPVLAVPEPITADLNDDDRKLIQYVKANPHITELDLGKLEVPKVTDAGLSILRTLENLQSLSLRNCAAIKGQTLNYITSLPLTYLELEGTDVGDAELSTLSSIHTLRHLNLKNTDVTDKGCSYLKALPNLQILSLANTTITPGALAELAKIKTLSTVDLAGDDVTGGFSHLVDSSVQKLTLTRDHLNPGDFQPISRMKSLQQLNISQTAVKDPDLKILSRAPALQKLDVSGCADITTAGLGNFSASAPRCYVTASVSKKTPLSSARPGSVAENTQNGTDSPPGHAGPNLIRNGSFEGPALERWLDLSTRASERSKINGWTVTSGSIGWIGHEWKAGKGDFCVELNGAARGAISQTIRTTAGTEYVAEFQSATNPEMPHHDTLSFEIVAAGQRQRFDIPYEVGATNADLRWRTYYWKFKANSAKTKLEFRSLLEGMFGACIDDVAVYRAQ